MINLGSSGLGIPTVAYRRDIFLPGLLQGTFMLVNLIFLLTKKKISEGYPFGVETNTPKKSIPKY